jgi:hypothetical protein
LGSRLKRTHNLVVHLRLSSDQSCTDSARCHRTPSGAEVKIT